MFRSAEASGIRESQNSRCESQRTEPAGVVSEVSLHTPPLKVSLSSSSPETHAQSKGAGYEADLTTLPPGRG